MNNKLNSQDLEKVVGGYRALDEGMITIGTCLQATKVTDPDSQTIYYLVQGGSIGSPSTYSCKKWVVKGENIIVNGEQCVINLDGFEYIYTIVNNPPAFIK